MNVFVKQVLTEFARAAGTATGHALGKWLAENLDEVVSRIHAHKAVPAQATAAFNDLETANFLRGGAFSEMKKQQLIGSALMSFSSVPISVRQPLLEWAIRNSQNDPARALYNFLFALSKYGKHY